MAALSDGNLLSLEIPRYGTRIGERIKFDLCNIFRKGGEKPSTRVFVLTQSV